MGPERLSFLGNTIPAGFRRRPVVIAPGRELAYVAADWSDALVIVESGVVELEAGSGARIRLTEGAVLWLAALPLRMLRCAGEEPAILVAVSRITPADRPGTSRPAARRRSPSRRRPPPGPGDGSAPARGQRPRGR